MLEAGQLTIFRDHKPFIYAFLQKSDSLSPRQFRHLDFISQFTKTSSTSPGWIMFVVDALSRVYSISDTKDFTSLAQSQQQDDELRQLLQSDTSLRL